MAELPKCPVCLFEYAEAIAIPRLLACGHTFCSDCLQNSIIDKNNLIECPTCQHLELVTKVEDFKVNFALLDIIAMLSNKKRVKLDISFGICDQHERNILFHCDTHQVYICVECTEDLHPMGSCRIVTCKKVMAEKSLKKVSSICTGIEKIKSSIVSVKKNIQDLATLETIHVLMAQELESVLLEIREKKKHQEKLEIDVNEMKRGLEKHLANMNGVSNSERETGIEISSERSNDFMNVVDVNYNKILPAKNSVDDWNKIIINFANCDVNPVHSWILLNNEPKRFGLTSTDHGFVHVHCCMGDLKPNSPAENDLVLPISDGAWSLNAVVTFMEISWGISSKGRVYIRPFKGSLRGEQFLLMCTGECGPSYKGTNFTLLKHRNDCSFIIGGDYEFNTGEGGRTIIQGVEMENLCKGSKVGLVGSWSGNKVAAQFWITTDVINSSVKRLCLGEVIKGMEILLAVIADNNSGKGAVISDCGVVLGWK